MLLGQWCAKSIGHEPRIAVEPVAGQAPPLSMLPFSKPGYCRVRRDSMAAPKAEMFFHLNGGSNHPSSVYKVKLPYDAVVCTRDVTRAHLRAPFTLPEAARERGGIVNIYPPEPRSTPPRCRNSISRHRLHHRRYHGGNRRLRRLRRRRRHRRNASLASCATTCPVWGTATSDTQGGRERKAEPIERLSLIHI